MTKNIIDEGIEDSEVSDETSKEYKTSNGVSIKPGDVLQVKSISEGEIVLIIPSKAKESEENSEGSYRVR